MTPALGALSKLNPAPFLETLKFVYKSPSALAALTIISLACIAFYAFRVFAVDRTDSHGRLLDKLPKKDRLSALALVETGTLTGFTGSQAARLRTRLFRFLIFIPVVLFLGGIGMSLVALVIRLPKNVAIAVPQVSVSSNDESELLAYRTFWLLQEPGASFELGPCPSQRCMKFTLGSLAKEGGKLIQQIDLSGDGFEYPDQEAIRKLFSEKDRAMMPKGQKFKPMDITAGSSVVYGADLQAVQLPIQSGAMVAASGTFHVTIKVVDTRADFMRIRVEVRPPKKI